MLLRRVMYFAVVVMSRIVVFHLQYFVVYTSVVVIGLACHLVRGPADDPLLVFTRFIGTGNSP